MLSIKFYYLTRDLTPSLKFMRSLEADTLGGNLGFAGKYTTINKKITIAMINSRKRIKSI